MRWLRWGPCVALVAAVACGSTPRPAPARPPEGNPAPPIVRRVSTSACAVALTFDDGPDRRFTPRILALLHRFSAHATFFVVGRQARANPSLIGAIRSAGHELANHGYDHRVLTRLDRSGVRRQVREGARAIADLTGDWPALFRPPYGAYGSDVLTAAQEAGETVVLWSKAPERSGRLPDVERGDVILLHDGGGDRSRTVGLLRALLEALSRRRLQAWTVSQLLTARSQGSAACSAE